jgi:tetratricopeptide (TPR) repeat protein
MDIRKTLGELDKLFETKRYGEVEGFLLSKIREAEGECDRSSLLTLFNELLGFYRSSGRGREAVALGEEIISLMKEAELEESASYATAMLNVATAYREAGRVEESMAYYEDALKLFGNTVSENDMRLAALYNNMSQACIVKKDYERACGFLRKALTIVAQNEGAEIEEAITNSNLAMALMKMNQLTEALAHMEKSLDIFENAGGPNDFHYSAALSAMGEVQFMIKDYPKALEYFNRALGEMELNMGKNLQYAMTCANISLVYDKLNNKEEMENYKAMAEAIYSRLGR